jgi:drug/metabolite transporter (DMT)-like permease
MADLTNTLLSQLLDPFRIGLLVALLFTTIRNAAATGWALPLVAGIAFVAYIIAMAFPVANQSIWHATGVGLVSNAVIVALLFALWSAYRRFQK